jgi:hypothetical protein
MRLSNIAQQHQDTKTEELYRPLRVAIEGLSIEKMQQF